MWWNQERCQFQNQTSLLGIISEMIHHTYTMTLYWTRKQSTGLSTTSPTYYRKCFQITWSTLRSEITTGVPRAHCLVDGIRSTRGLPPGGVTGWMKSKPIKLSTKVLWPLPSDHSLFMTGNDSCFPKGHKKWFSFRFLFALGFLHWVVSRRRICRNGDQELRKA